MKWILSDSNWVLKCWEILSCQGKTSLLLRNIVLPCYFLTASQVRSWNSGFRKKNVAAKFHDEGQQLWTICWNLFNLFNSFSVGKSNKSKWTWCSFKCLVRQKVLVRHNKMDPVVFCIVFSHCVMWWLSKVSSRKPLYSAGPERKGINISAVWLPL